MSQFTKNVRKFIGSKMNVDNTFVAWHAAAQSDCVVAGLTIGGDAGEHVEFYGYGDPKDITEHLEVMCALQNQIENYILAVEKATEVYIAEHKGDK